MYNSNGLNKTLLFVCFVLSALVLYDHFPIDFKTASADSQRSSIKANAYQASYELMNSANNQNWYFGIDDADRNRLKIGRGYSAGQGVVPAISIDTDDTVSIGNPISAGGAMLDVVSNNDWVAWFRRQGTGVAGTESLVRHEHYSGGSVAPLPIFTGISSRGTISSPMPITTNDPLLVIDGRGYDGSGASHTEYRPGISDTAAQVSFFATQPWNGNAHGSEIRFMTTSKDSSSPSLRAVLQDNGDFNLSKNIIADAAIMRVGLYATEITEPAAPSANTGVIYLRDNGSGKSQLVVKFSSGAIQVLATEP